LCFHHVSVTVDRASRAFFFVFAGFPFHHFSSMASSMSLPPPRRTAAAVPVPSTSQSTTAAPIAAAAPISATDVPKYPHRARWRPKSEADFGDGGAYPECHVAQYPRGMGRTKSYAKRNFYFSLSFFFSNSFHLFSTQVVALKSDQQSGSTRFDSILSSTDTFVKSTHSDLVPSQHLVGASDLARPDDAAVDASTAKTKAALERKLAGSTQNAALHSAAYSASLTQGGQSSFVRYTPAGGDGSRGETRTVKLVTQAVDPMEPPKFRHKKVTKGESEAPVPVMHSPPRKVTLEDQEAWKVPTAISNWKNKGGFTIPLDKRLQADGRGLQEVAINDNFAKFAQSLYIAEAAAREEVAKRAAIQERIAMNEKEQHEEKLRALARDARLKRVAGGGATTNASLDERAGAAAAGDARRDVSESSSESDDDNNDARHHDDPEKAERDRIRAERRRERERQLRMEAMGNRRGKLTRDAERDVSERIALGMQVAGGAGGGGEVQFDQRLFNQSGGVQSTMGADIEYNIYDGPMHQRGELANHVYRPRAVKDNADEAADQNAQYQALLTSDKFRPAKGFSGAERAAGDASAPRDGPVQFEKESEADPFGLDSFLQSAKEQQSGGGHNERKRSRHHDDDNTDPAKRR
jgi:SNW domain-containing protein 1